MLLVIIMDSEFVDIEFKLTASQNKILMKKYEQEKAKRNGNYTFDEFMDTILEIVLMKLEHEKDKMKLD